MAFDLFGLKKGLPTEEPPAAVPAGVSRAPGLSPKAWVGLAAADLVMVLVCAGVVTQRWAATKEPARKPAAEAKKPEPKPEPPAAQPEPAKDEPKPEAKKPEPEKKPEPKAQAKKPAEPEKKVPLGRPSVLAAPPSAREAAPKTEDHSAKPAPKAAAAKPAKAATRPVPFSYPDADAKEVYLAGPFLVRSGGRKMMFKDSKGVWTTTVYLNTGQNYKYRFEVVDAKGGKKLTAAQQVEVLPAD